MTTGRVGTAHQASLLREVLEEGCLDEPEEQDVLLHLGQPGRGVGGVRPSLHCRGQEEGGEYVDAARRIRELAHGDETEIERDGVVGETTSVTSAACQPSALLSE